MQWKKGYFIFIVLLLLTVSIFSISFPDQGFWKNVIYASAGDTVYDYYHMMAGSYQVPEKGGSEESKMFAGHTIYRYLYPYCPSWNTEDRPKLFQYHKDGSFQMAGNFAIGGEKTFLIPPKSRDETVSIGSEVYNTSKEQVSNINFSSASPDVYVGGKMELEKGVTGGVAHSWQSDNPLGPSIYLDTVHSAIHFDPSEYSLSPRWEGNLVNTNFNPLHPIWKEYYNGGFFYPVDMSQRGDFFYIADKGSRQIIRSSTTTGKHLSLGNESWEWKLEGITVEKDIKAQEESEEDEYKNIYVTDSLHNRVIRTEIDGGDWLASYDPANDYHTKLKLTGEEEIHVPEINPGATTSKAFFYDSGYYGHKVNIRNTDGHLLYDSSKDTIKFK
ncbi:MAG TPA: hypothetical protein VKO42_02010, partial [Patescibacteria group bacterium]|nr:hypothetical protein [Patescibacteria group bacterium]